MTFILSAYFNFMLLLNLSFKIMIKTNLLDCGLYSVIVSTNPGSVIVVVVL